MRIPLGVLLRNTWQPCGMTPGLRILRRLKCDDSVALMIDAIRKAHRSDFADSPGAATALRKRASLGLVALGAALMVLVLAVLIQWLAAGPQPVSPGTDHFGGIKLVLLRVLEWGQFAVFLALVGWFVIKPIVEHRSMGFDGLLILASFAMNVWDPLDNYFVFAFQYNANFINLGSWGGFIPGWQGESPELWAVPLGFIFGCYTWSWFAAVRLGSYVLLRLSEAQRAWSRWSQYLVVYLVAVAQCAVSEIAFMRLGHWAYPTTVPGFTLWEGQYAWPWFNPFLYGLTWLALIWLRETAMSNSEGLSVIERGIDQLPGASRQQTTMRFLSIFAFSSVVYILTYFLPFNVIMMHGTLNTHLPSYFPVP